MSEGSGFKKVFVWIFIGLVVVGLGVFGFTTLREAGYFPDVGMPSESSEPEAEKEYPIGLLWGLLIFTLLAVLFLNFVYQHGSGENIDVDQAIVIVKERAQTEAGLIYAGDDRRYGNYIDIAYFTGQFINGDPDGHWYFISLVRDYPVGVILPPDNQCLRTYVMYSRDYKRTIGWVRGISAYNMYEMTKAKLQKSTTPDDLHKILNEAVTAAGVNKALTEGGGSEE